MVWPGAGHSVAALVTSPEETTGPAAGFGSAREGTPDVIDASNDPMRLSDVDRHRPSSRNAIAPTRLAGLPIVVESDHQGDRSGAGACVSNAARLHGGLGAQLVGRSSAWRGGSIWRAWRGVCPVDLVEALLAARCSLPRDSTVRPVCPGPTCRSAGREERPCVPRLVQPGRPWQLHRGDEPQRCSVTPPPNSTPRVTKRSVPRCPSFSSEAPASPSVAGAPASASIALSRSRSPQASSRIARTSSELARRSADARVAQDRRDLPRPRDDCAGTLQPVSCRRGGSCALPPRVPECSV